RSRSKRLGVRTRISRPRGIARRISKRRVTILTTSSCRGARTRDRRSGRSGDRRAGTHPARPALAKKSRSIAHRRNLPRLIPRRNRNDGRASDQEEEMSPADSLQVLEHYGVVILPALAIAEQIGIPLPAVPALLAVGTLAAHGRISIPLVLGAVSVAALATDFAS